jgi:signal transduction histidine kinase
LHNAIKFTPEQGVIKVTLSEKSGEIHCVIADNGIGIPKEDQIHIFERFYKADKSHDRSIGGNGLGLSLVKKIIEMHGGSVRVESGMMKSKKKLEYTDYNSSGSLETLRH